MKGSVAAYVVVLLAIAAVSAALSHKTCSATAHPRAVNSSVSALIKAITTIPRGGGRGPFSNLPFSSLPPPFSKSLSNPRRNRRIELQENVRNLEIQLRKSCDEVRQLRTQLRSSTSTDRSTSAKIVRDNVAIQTKLREEVDLLRTMVEKLESAREELEVMLERETQRADMAEAALEKERIKVADIESKAKSEMEVLRTTLLKKSRRELEETEVAAERRLEAELARVEAKANVRVMDERTKGEEAVERAKVMSEEAIKKEKARSEEAVEKEKARGEEEKVRLEEAVESERAKLKKLVKALADKEKRAVEAAERRTKELKQPPAATDAVPAAASGKKKKKSKSNADGDGTTDSTGDRRKKTTKISGSAASGIPVGKKKVSGTTVRGTTSGSR